MMYNNDDFVMLLIVISFIISVLVSYINRGCI